MATRRTAVKLFACVTLVALAGCSSLPVSLSDATPVPASRMYLKRAPAANDATVIVLRDKRPGPVFPCRLLVNLDGRKAAFMGAGEAATFPVTAGHHTLTVQISQKGLCGINPKSPQAAVTFTAEPGRTMEFRLGVTSVGLLLYEIPQAPHS